MIRIQDPGIFLTPDPGWKIFGSAWIGKRSLVRTECQSSSLPHDINIKKTTPYSTNVIMNRVIFLYTDWTYRTLSRSRGWWASHSWWPDPSGTLVGCAWPLTRTCRSGARHSPRSRFSWAGSGWRRPFSGTAPPPGWAVRKLARSSIGSRQCCETLEKELRQLAEINDEFDNCFGTALTGIQDEFGSFSCYINSLKF